MIEILEFTFASFWRFLGVLVLLSVIGSSLSMIRLVDVRIGDANLKADE